MIYTMNHNRLIFRFLLFLFLYLHTNAIYSQSEDAIYYQRINKLISPENIPSHHGLYDSVQTKIRQHHSENRQAVNRFYIYEANWTAQLQEAELPVIFKYIPLLISHMDTRYRGDYQKVGLWGIDRITGIRYNLRMDSLIDERFDPAKATSVAIKELQKLMQRFEGNVWECILAYYSSPANVNASKIRMGADNPSPWELQNDSQRFPTDVITSLLSWIYVCHYSSLSSQKEANSPILTSDVKCLHTIQIKDLLDVLQIGQNRFEKYNPALIGKIIPESAILHLPPDKVAVFSSEAEKLGQLYIEKQIADSIAKAKADSIEKAKVTAQIANSSNNSSSITYIVKKGDVLGKIAQKYHVSVAEIKRWNHLKSDMIQIGQKLIINP